MVQIKLVFLTFTDLVKREKNAEPTYLMAEHDFLRILGMLEY